MEELKIHTAFSNALYTKDKYPRIPLQTIVSVEKWSNLHHFELSGLVMDDCISLLKTLPRSVRSIERSMLRFLDTGDWYLMLPDARQMVSETASKPRITLGLLMSKSNPELRRGKWIEKEVQYFL